MRLLVVFSLGVLFLLSCKGKKQLSSERASEKVSVCDSITMIEGGYGKPSNTVFVIEMNVEGDCLNAKVKYQGCENDRIRLMWNGMLKKSLPSQATLGIGKEQSEACDEWREKDCRFDLSPFKSPVYGGKVLLSVGTFEKAVLYTASNSQEKR